MLLNLFYGLFGLGVVLLLTAVILTFVLHIPDLVDEVTGRKARRQIKRIKELNSSTGSIEKASTGDVYKVMQGQGNKGQDDLEELGISSSMAEVQREISKELSESRYYGSAENLDSSDLSSSGSQEVSSEGEEVEYPEGEEVEKETGYVEDAGEKPTGYVEDVREKPARYVGEVEEIPTGYVEESEEKPTGYVDNSSESEESPTGYIKEEEEKATGYVGDEEENETGFVEDSEETPTGYVGSQEIKVLEEQTSLSVEEMKKGGQRDEI